MAFSLTCKKSIRLYTCRSNLYRLYSNTQTSKKGLVLGAYQCKDSDQIQLTSAAEKYNTASNGKLKDQINSIRHLKTGQTLTLWGLDEEFQSVAVVKLKKETEENVLEKICAEKESIRIAASAGCKALDSIGIKNISVESFGDADSSAEGSKLCTWKYQGLKTKKDELAEVSLYLGNESECASWEHGILKASAQNIARRLADTPANLMTPTIFAEDTKQILQNVDVKVEAHDLEWARKEKMESFLSVARGSCEAPVFLELTYSGGAAGENPIVLIGKGVTFDAGGISIKPAGAMDEMRADMSGAACVVGTMYALAKAGVQSNIKVLVPLCENLPSSTAIKPGDVVVARNGKSICVDNTDAEGRLILADALSYSGTFNPKWVLDIATLTGAMRVALGGAATGVFSNSDELYGLLESAAASTGDRVWRFPLWKHYSDLITKNQAYDLNNIGKGKGGGSCTAAAFLREFVPDKTNWMHLDIAGVMGPTDSTPYLTKGMTGRPTRTLIDLVQRCSGKS